MISLLVYKYVSIRCCVPGNIYLEPIKYISISIYYDIALTQRARSKNNRIARYVPPLPRYTSKSVYQLKHSIESKKGFRHPHKNSLHIMIKGMLTTLPFGQICLWSVLYVESGWVQFVHRYLRDRQVHASRKYETTSSASCFLFQIHTPTIQAMFNAHHVLFIQLHVLLCFQYSASVNSSPDPSKVPSELQHRPTSLKIRTEY
mmetsp:Transcript_27615/g.52573  ORF Transcript_27615/g.52573 Transcript_27615/m.52573 type:complete len:203 (+) Transcript_27615:1138-1746(+)